MTVYQIYSATVVNRRVQVSAPVSVTVGTGGVVMDANGAMITNSAIGTASYFGTLKSNPATVVAGTTVSTSVGGVYPAAAIVPSQFGLGGVIPYTGGLAQSDYPGLSASINGNGVGGAVYVTYCD